MPYLEKCNEKFRILPEKPRCIKRMENVYYWCLQVCEDLPKKSMIVREYTERKENLLEYSRIINSGKKIFQMPPDSEAK